MSAALPSIIREKHEGGPAEGSSVRLWLRLLSCTMAIEKDVQRRLAARGATLPRFDVLAALERAPDGLTMGALSRALLVSNGNVTGLVRKLGEDGLVAIETDPADRRSSIVRLTPAGAREFAALAERHTCWIDALFAGLPADERDRLYAALGALKVSIAQGTSRDT
ncbi:MAG: MarR family winged helix-turn-helix transcriptional regulator [Allosphingosinicella sp.]|uniref:MarR family winged helix-turn-helix transcriptional regulator n=1 Tax=Allosphingosinicella sp. TaxID=2823234 RepID=UPI0039222B07